MYTYPSTTCSKFQLQLVYSALTAVVLLAFQGLPLMCEPVLHPKKVSMNTNDNN